MAIFKKGMVPSRCPYFVSSFSSWLPCFVRLPPSPDGAKTTFQTSQGWRPTLDNRADAVMVYGVGGTGLPAAPWKTAWPPGARGGTRPIL